MFEKSILIVISIYEWLTLTALYLFRGLCAIIYFIFGLLCFDRFTSKAYLSSNDPLVSTAIPQPTSSRKSDPPKSGAFQPPQLDDYEDNA
jgi:hypothetical protein